MQLIYTDDPPLFHKEQNSIFLAGPTPRSATVPSWRPAALVELEILKYSGTVCIPEYRDFSAHSDYEYYGRVEWERDCLYNCETIVFWVPRQMQDMPAFTTNVEFGYWMAKNPAKVFYGRPDGAPKCGYLDWLYGVQTRRRQAASLSDVLKQAIDWMTVPEPA